MSETDPHRLTFETLFSDPLIRLVMAIDGVTEQELADVLHLAWSAALARDRLPLCEMIPAGHA